MTNERQLETNPYLQMRGDSQLRAKHAFERGAGWRFGLTLGVLIVVMGYGFDAIQLDNVHAEFWWAKFALACLTILPLALVAGAIGGFVNWLAKLPFWVGFGIAAGWFAIHIPFDGARWLLQNFDPNLRAIEFLPIPAGAADSFGMLATLGGCLGLLMGLAQTVIVNWAWERSTDDYKLTPGGWALFLLVLPIVFAFAFLFDGTAHAPLRTPMQLVNAVVQSGLNDAPDLDSSQMEMHRALVYLTGKQWRKNFTPDYTMRLASSEPSVVGEAFVDVAFKTGFNLRCRITTFGEFTGACSDVNADYIRYITEFVPRGSFRCDDCQARVTPQAAAWRAQNARALGNSDKISVRHVAGSGIIVHVQAGNYSAFECLFWGATTIIVQECKNL